MLSQQETSRSRWIGIAARVFAFTFFLSLLSFAVVLLVSILATIVHALIGHTAPNLMYAYKHIAFPSALMVGAIVLVVTLVIEIRNYRQRKVLAGIEQASRV
jgi:hypothetical protein